MELTTILFRFALVFIFSMLFGFERQKAHKSIGFGTFIFVAIGACGLAITGLLINPEDPFPLLTAVVTGIGFLGAGALIKTGDKVFGFTSAASIWLFASIGLIIGIGQYVLGILMYVIIWTIMGIDKLLEIRGIGTYQKKLLIVTNKGIDQDELGEILKGRKYKIVNMDINKKTGQCTINILVEGNKVGINQIPKQLFKTSWVESFKIE